MLSDVRSYAKRKSYSEAWQIIYFIRCRPFCAEARQKMNSKLHLFYVRRLVTLNTKNVSKVTWTLSFRIHTRAIKSTFGSWSEGFMEHNTVLALLWLSTKICLAGGDCRQVILVLKVSTHCKYQPNVILTILNVQGPSGASIDESTSNPRKSSCDIARYFFKYPAALQISVIITTLYLAVLWELGWLNENLWSGSWSDFKLRLSRFLHSKSLVTSDYSQPDDIYKIRRKSLSSGIEYILRHIIIKPQLIFHDNRTMGNDDDDSELRLEIICVALTRKKSIKLPYRREVIATFFSPFQNFRRLPELDDSIWLSC